MVVLAKFRDTTVLPNLRVATRLLVTVLWKPLAQVLVLPRVRRTPLSVLGTVLESRP